MSTPMVSSGSDLLAGTYGSTLPWAGDVLGGSAMVGLSPRSAPAVKGEGDLAERAPPPGPSAPAVPTGRPDRRRQNRPPTQDEMAKNMKASAFCCGGRSVAVPQLGGYGRTLLLLSFSGPPDTCMSENTTLPQRSSRGFLLGVENWKFWVSCVVASFCQ